MRVVTLSLRETVAICKCNDHQGLIEMGKIHMGRKAAVKKRRRRQEEEHAPKILKGFYLDIQVGHQSSADEVC